MMNLKERSFITVGKHIYEVRNDFLPERQCFDCAAFGNHTLCKKLPHCDGIYFRKLTGYEIRQLQKNGLIEK